MIGMMLVDQNSRPARNIGIAAQCDSKTQQPRQANAAEASRVATVKALAMVGDRSRSFARNQEASQIKAISNSKKQELKRDQQSRGAMFIKSKQRLRV
jgi:predicted GIY-YIG superfamily endonuclease